MSEREELTFSGKTVEAAKEAAIEALKITSDKLEFTIVQEPSAGFLGFGKKDAIISVKKPIEEKAEEIKPTPSDNKTVTVEEKKENKSEEKPKKNFISSKEIRQRVDTATKKAVENLNDTENGDPSNWVDKGKTEDEDFPPSVYVARDYLKEVAKAYGLGKRFDFDISIHKLESGAEFVFECPETKGGDPALVIGKSGEVINALQYLASVIVNRDIEDYYRINVNCNNYREKRKKKLIEQAERSCKYVLFSGETVFLPPMNPYERRIIHAVVNETEGLVSESTGEEPHRKVSISLADPASFVPRADYIKYKDRKNRNKDRNRYNGRNRNGSYKPRNKNSSNNKKRYNGNKNYNGNNKKRYISDKDYVPKPKSMDSMKTSFEREYSKPKPEDELGGKLYGKIDL